mmetsp:Transcript_29871/g.71200  ORF Transcript_29871/g.71200 Transcript_29871/m.71200 type:complete len:423 (+) Transcript_29871:451-1719(+)
MHLPDPALFSSLEPVPLPVGDLQPRVLGVVSDVPAPAHLHVSCAVCAAGPIRWRGAEQPGSAMEALWRHELQPACSQQRLLRRGALPGSEGVRGCLPRPAVQPLALQRDRAGARAQKALPAAAVGLGIREARPGANRAGPQSHRRKIEGALRPRRGEGAPAPRHLEPLLLKLERRRKDVLLQLLERVELALVQVLLLPPPRCLGRAGHAPHEGAPPPGVAPDRGGARPRRRCGRARGGLGRPGGAALLLRAAEAPLVEVRLELARPPHDVRDASVARVDELRRRQSVQLALGVRLDVPAVLPELREGRWLAEELAGAEPGDGVGGVEAEGVACGEGRLGPPRAPALELALALGDKVDRPVPQVKHGAGRVYDRLQEVRHRLKLEGRDGLEGGERPKEQQPLLDADAVDVVEDAVEVLAGDCE